MTLQYRFFVPLASALAFIQCIRPGKLPAIPAVVASSEPQPEPAPQQVTFPAIAAGPRLHPPAVERTVLGNGLVVMVVQTNEASLLRLAFVDLAAGDNGSNAAPGLAVLTAFAVHAGMIGKDGVVVREPEQFGEKDFWVSQNGAAFHVTALGSEAEEAFETLARVIQNPALDAQALRDARSQAKDIAVGQSGSLPATLSRLVATEIYGKSGPFARFVSGSERERAALADTAVHRFYQERYQPQGSALLIAGPIESTRAFALARQRFESWRPTNAEPFAESVVSVIEPAQRARAVGVLASKSSVRMAIGFPCPRRDSGDTAAADLTATLLGELHDGVLGTQIRIQGGGFVAPQARCMQMRSAGLFAISLELKPENVESALEGVEKALQLMRTELPSETDLADARSLYLGHRAALLNTSEGSLRVLQDQFLSGLGDAAFDRFEQSVEETTAADIRSFALRYLDPANMVVAAEGSHAALDAAFAKLGRARWLTLEDAERRD